jgi:hypothetical protein
MRRAAAVLIAALALAVAGCGDSPEDNAHSSGKKVGVALRQVSDAGSADQLQSALGNLRNAVGDVSDDVRGRVRSQARVQQDTVNQAIGSIRDAITSTDPTTRTNARNELQAQLQSLRNQAAANANTRDSVTNAFWDGVKDGYDD